MSEQLNLVKAPFGVMLTPNGKTLFVIYPGKRQVELAEAFIDLLGEPEFYGRITDGNPDNLWVGYPHQNIPDDFKNLAERMATANLLEDLGYVPEGGFIL